MSKLDHGKPNINIEQNLDDQEPRLLCKYKLTHSDATSELFLTIGRKYEEAANSGWFTRMIRGEVLGEWLEENGLNLCSHPHFSCGLAYGPAQWRQSIFKQHMCLVLEAICYGDRHFSIGQPSLQQAPITIHYHAKKGKRNMVGIWGTVK